MIQSLERLKQVMRNVLAISTPGPWVFDETDDGHEILMGEAISNPGCYSSHMVIEYNHGVYPDDGKQFEEAEANAQLIANAPAWIKRLLDENEQQAVEIEKLREIQRVLVLKGVDDNG